MTNGLYVGRGAPRIRMEDTEDPMIRTSCNSRRNWDGNKSTMDG